MEEREGKKLPPLTERGAARGQPHRETRRKCLEHRLDTLIELVKTLVTPLGHNTANVAPAIPLGFPLANGKGGEA